MPTWIQSAARWLSSPVPGTRGAVPWWAAIGGGIVAAFAAKGALESADGDAGGTGGAGGGGSGGAGPSGPVDDWAPRNTTQAGECDLTEKEGAKLFRSWTIAAWGERPKSPRNILRECSIGSPSEHWTGRAWDWMVPSQAAGDGMANSLVADNGELARRAGIQYVIWDGRMWRAYDQGDTPRGTWAPYTGAEGHADHVHVSFSTEGAAAETSLYPAIEAGWRWPGAPYPDEGVA